MPCFNPIKAYKDPEQGIIFDDRLGYNITLPCGQCVGCRLERSRQWAVRIMHEASLYEDNCFITLTYNDENCPQSLDYSVYQKFMKRLRRHFEPRNIRFYMCGEYGEENFRPHFHACIFNLDFADKYYWKTVRGNRIYRSPTLEMLWPYGFSTIGALTFQSAAYVSRYVMKKITGRDAPDYYRRVDQETGEVTYLTPEFNKMSLKPGIGAAWFEKYQNDVYPNDYVIVNGYKAKPPRYYDKLLLKKSLPVAAEIETKRFEKAQKYVDNNTQERLKVREEVLKAKLKHLKREI